MSSPETDSEMVLELAEEFLARNRRGERPSVQEFIDRRPDLAERVRNVFAAMALMENFALVDEGVRKPAPQQVGEYRIVRELGRGGMGVVYEAEQVSLGRHVALKLLPDRFIANARLRGRFEREAKAAGRLHHTNIVPVFGVGEHDGQPFYAMQFIDGVGLDEVLAALQRLRQGAGAAPSSPDGAAARPNRQAEDVAGCLLTGRFAPADSDPDVTVLIRKRALDVPSSSSTPPVGAASEPRARRASLIYASSVARLGAQAAAALEYAHRQEVLHRDVKPSNLLLDGRGTLWVGDFGLAKTDDQQDLTHTGEVLGTLRYMPPEAFDGKADARSDVFSLGLTLYELLAFRPAFDAPDRAVLIGQVMAADPPRLRTLNPETPRDLETIVHKAMDREPAHRYASAGDLAADLRRFVADEPVQARRLSVGERLLRWSRRNRTAAAALTAIGLLVLLLTAGSGLVALYYQRQEEVQRGLVGERETQRSNAETARTLAEDRRIAMRVNLYQSEMNRAGQALDALAGVDLARDMLSHWGPAGADADLRGWEWYYLNGMCAQPLRSYRGPSAMQSVAWSPDGTRLAGAGRDGAVRVWDVVSGKVVVTLRGHVGWVNSVAWSPDRTRLASAGADGSVKVWDVASARPTRALHGHTAEVLSVAWSPDGTRLASASHDFTVKVWDAVRGKETFTLRGHTGPVASAAWSPDGTQLATASQDCTVKVWDAASGKEALTLRGHTDYVRSVAWSPAGDCLATASYDQTVKVWDVASGEETQTLRGHVSEATSAAWSPDGARLASASWDRTVKVWDVGSGKLAFTFRGHSESIHSVAWSPDGSRLASASQDRSIKVLDVGSSETLTMHENKGTPFLVAWAPDGLHLASASWDKTVKLWDAASGKQIHTLYGHAREVYCVAWSPDGARLATASHDHTVKVWDAASGEEVLTLPGHAREVQSVAWSSDGGRLASASKDGRLKVWDAALGKELLSLRGHTSEVNSVAWSPDGLRLVSASNDGTARVWDVAAGKEVLTLRGDVGDLNSAAWSPDGTRLATAGEDRTIKLWDVAHGKLLHPLRGHSSSVNKVAWSPDGARLASAGADQTLKIWDVATGKETLTLGGHGGQVYSAAWSPDGMRLASASWDRAVRIWDATLGYLEADPSLDAATVEPRRMRLLARMLRLRARRSRLLGSADRAEQDERRVHALYRQWLIAEPSSAVAAAELADFLRSTWRGSVAWRPLRAVRLHSAGGATLSQHLDDSIRAGGKSPDNDTYTVTANVGLMEVRALRLEVLPDGALVDGGPGRSSGGNFHLSEVRVSAAPTRSPEKTVPVALARVGADYQPEGYKARQAMGAAWSADGGQGKPHEAIFALVQPVRFPGGSTLTIHLDFNDPVWKQHTLGRFRLSIADRPDGLRQAHLRRLAGSPCSGWLRLGAAYALRGEWRQARDVLAGAPGAGGEQVLLALANEQLGSPDEAKRCWLRAFAWLAKHPAPQALRELARDDVERQSKAGPQNEAP